jgi:RNA 3'-terminal phosphate cyclase (ATP)
MITIDGSQGEGGGQILRTSLALSMVTGKPFRIDKIRAGRAKPGLMRQHLTAVQAATTVCEAGVEGAAIGSTSLTFNPGKVKPGDYSFVIGTAGSVTLVLQTILPALMIADKKSTIVLEGGTHNPMAPPWDFLAKSFIPVINKMGPKLTSSLSNYGFYPAGGGKFTVIIEPSPLRAIEICNRGGVIEKKAMALFSHIPFNVAKRELLVVKNKLSWPDETMKSLEIKNSIGPGNVVIIELVSENITEVFTGFGERSVSAELVANSVCEEVKEYLAADVPVGIHLADQLMIPMAMAGRGTFCTLPLTRHSETNLDVISKFLPVNYKVECMENHKRRVTFESL